MFCRKCGSTLIEGALFCDECGTRIESVDATELKNNQQPANAVSAENVQPVYSAPAPAQPAPAQPAPAQPAPVQQVNRTAQMQEQMRAVRQGGTAPSQGGFVPASPSSPAGPAPQSPLYQINWNSMSTRKGTGFILVVAVLAILIFMSVKGADYALVNGDDITAGRDDDDDETAGSKDKSDKSDKSDKKKDDKTDGLGLSLVTDEIPADNLKIMIADADKSDYYGEYTGTCYVSVFGLEAMSSLGMPDDMLEALDKIKDRTNKVTATFSGKKIEIQTEDLIIDEEAGPSEFTFSVNDDDRVDGVFTDTDTDESPEDNMKYTMSQKVVLEEDGQIYCQQALLLMVNGEVVGSEIVRVYLEK